MAHNLYPGQKPWQAAQSPGRSWRVGLIATAIYGILLHVSRVFCQLLKMKKVPSYKWMSIGLLLVIATHSIINFSFGASH